MALHSRIQASGRAHVSNLRTSHAHSALSSVWASSPTSLRPATAGGGAGGRQTPLSSRGRRPATVVASAAAVPSTLLGGSPWGTLQFHFETLPGQLPISPPPCPAAPPHRHLGRPRLCRRLRPAPRTHQVGQRNERRPAGHPHRPGNVQYWGGAVRGAPCLRRCQCLPPPSRSAPAAVRRRPPPRCKRHRPAACRLRLRRWRHRGGQSGGLCAAAAARAGRRRVESSRCADRSAHWRLGQLRGGLRGARAVPRCQDGGPRCG